MAPLPVYCASMSFVTRGLATVSFALAFATNAHAAEQAEVSASRSSSDGASRSAAPMRGRFAIGAMRTVAGLNGLMVRGYVLNRLSLGWVTGVATFSHRDTDENGDYERVRTVGRVGFGPEVFFWPVQGDRAHQVHADVGIGARMTAYVGFLRRLEEQREETLDTPVELAFEMPVALQLFIGPRVAIMPEFGVVFRYVPGRREPDENGESDANPGTGAGERLGTSNGPGFGFELGDHAGLFMGVGVGYFFGKLRR